MATLIRVRWVLRYAVGGVGDGRLCGRMEKGMVRFVGFGFGRRHASLVNMYVSDTSFCFRLPAYIPAIALV